jgi:hypothetical protein
MAVSSGYPSFALSLSPTNEIRWNQQVTFERATACRVSEICERILPDWISADGNGFVSFEKIILANIRDSRSGFRKLYLLEEYSGATTGRNFLPKQRAPMKSSLACCYFHARITSRSVPFCRSPLASLVFTIIQDFLEQFLTAVCRCRRTKTTRRIIWQFISINLAYRTFTLGPQFFAISALVD